MSTKKPKLQDTLEVFLDELVITNRTMKSLEKTVAKKAEQIESTKILSQKVCKTHNYYL